VRQRRCERADGDTTAPITPKTAKNREGFPTLDTLLDLRLHKPNLLSEPGRVVGDSRRADPS
jgi:hypothetical protein